MQENATISLAVSRDGLDQIDGSLAKDENDQAKLSIAIPPELPCDASKKIFKPLLTNEIMEGKYYTHTYSQTYS